MDMLEGAKLGKARRGKKELIKHLEGGKLTRKQAMLAKCYDCNGLGEENKCSVENCAILPYSQFKIPTDSSSMSKERQETHRGGSL